LATRAGEPGGLVVWIAAPRIGLNAAVRYLRWRVPAATAGATGRDNARRCPRSESQKNVPAPPEALPREYPERFFPRYAVAAKIGDGINSSLGFVRQERRHGHRKCPAAVASPPPTGGLRLDHAGLAYQRTATRFCRSRAGMRNGAPFAMVTAPFDTDPVHAPPATSPRDIIAAYAGRNTRASPPASS